MTTNFIGIIHIIAALILIIMVLLQDSKSNGALGMGGSTSSNSLLGATGAQSLLSKVTVWVAVIFAITCLTLAAKTSSSTKSVVDGLVPEAAPVTAPAVPAVAPEAATSEAATPEAAAPSTEAAPAVPAPAPAQ